MVSEGVMDMNVFRRKINILYDERNKLEKQLQELYEILEANNVSMEDPVVDADGYPRHDIDVYQVRHAKHDIICIRNDIKKLNEKIEETVLNCHSTARSSGLQVASNSNFELEHKTPIAVVSTVVPNSPADEAGLQSQDLITAFGSLNGENFNNLIDIMNIVKRSLNTYIKVGILRNNTFKTLYLKPRVWSGKGTLGCVVLPYEKS